MKSTVVFAFRIWNLGGGHLLALRWAEQYIHREYSVRIIYQEINDDFVCEEIERLKIECIKVNDWWNEEEWRRGLYGAGSVYVLVFSLNDYFRIAALKTGNIKVAMYLWDDYQYKIKEDDKLSHLNYVFTHFSIKSIFNVGGIITADHNYLRGATDYYKLSARSVKNIHNVNIGIDIVDVTEASILERAINRGELKIVSIARAEFPFKGYLIGLLDLLETFKADYRIKVSIISYGSGVQRLEDHIKEKEFPENIEVQLYGKTEYTKLKEVFSDCTLYIGMGTSVLDAAQYGIPCIVVKPWTMRIIGRDFFSHEHPQLGFYDKGDENDVSAQISAVMDMTDDEYFSLGKQTRRTVLDLYDNTSNAWKIMDAFASIPERSSSRAVNVSYQFRKCMHAKKMKIKEK